MDGLNVRMADHHADGANPIRTWLFRYGGGRPSQLPLSWVLTCIRNGYRFGHGEEEHGASSANSRGAAHPAGAFDAERHGYGIMKQAGGDSQGK